MIIVLQTLIFFRQSLITAIERFLGTYYRKLSLKFIGSEDSDDEESDDHVFAEYDDEKGVVFYPPVYAQRYAAVTDCLMDERWCGILEKVVDFGYHDMSFIKYLKDVPGIKHILGVDIETIPLRCSSDLLGCENYVSRRENPLQVTLFHGNAADPDYRLIGCDAVVAIEMIEHMLPHDLERLIHTVFGFIKPWVAIFTTPNGDFNVLFKSLEKNGLRRLDHMFEWTREQFHDWCSNIVARYPQYTVTCKGIGPGPADTIHLGCCSQLALFVSKDYHKQPDLNLNSLALVAKAPSPNNLSDMFGSWESPDTLVENNMFLPNSIESYTELLLDRQSCMTILISSPTFSLESIEYKDKISQCNLESELGKNFLMFEDEVYFNILVPSRKKYFRVYEIEDVASRLNCSTIQVKKFSKASQNLMAKNKIDSIAHTREVVDEIRHLTKMLNFKKEHMNTDVPTTWCNINWGMNAPYWNQYYRIVREYNYPFEVKTDECRILDLITEEINKRIDTECAENIADMHKLEIPIDHLMLVVEHITTDVDKVKELLEWNGYEIVDDILVYSRLIVDNLSEGSQDDDWPDDNMSDWEPTDARSSSISDGGTTVPDFYGHCLRRALDQKVRNLRNLLSADEDITTELDRVVCRLMKLALHTSKGCKDPPPVSWMQCKLFDLLSLTENAIEKRRRLLFDRTYPLKPIEYCKEDSENKDNIAIDHMGTESTAHRIMSEYQHLDPSSGSIGHDSKCDQSDDFEFEDYKSATSNEFREDENKVYEKSTKDGVINDLKELDELRNTENEDAHVIAIADSELVVYPKRGNMSGLIGSEESTCSSFDGVESKQDRHKQNKNNILNTYYKINYSNSLITTGNKTHKRKSKNNLKTKHILKTSRIKIHKCVSTKKSSHFNLIKFDYTEYKKYKSKEKKQQKDYPRLQSIPPRPIPSTLNEFCHPQSNLKDLHQPICDINKNKLNQLFHNIAAPEESMFIGIVTEDGEETIAMRRNIGTDPEIDSEIGILVNEDMLETEINVTNEILYGKLDLEIDTSKTIFIYDLNEPSTSKGIRHLNADVQCGPDDPTTQGTTLCAATSFMKVPQLFTTGIKIEEQLMDIQENKNSYDFGTCTEWSDNIVTGCTKSIGIKIKGSDDIINNKIDCYTTTEKIEHKTYTPSEIPNFELKTETKLLKPVSSAKFEDSSSDFCCSVGSFPKLTTQIVTPSTDTSDIPTQSISNEKKVVLKISRASFDKPILVCGGIHVHSYREKQVSEDVVYQGEWQRKQNSLKKISLNPISRNNVSVQKKNKINSSEYVGVPEIKKISRKTPISNPRYYNKNQEPSIKTAQNKRNCVANPVNHNIMDKRNDVMVASKITVCSHIPKSMKTIYTTKKRMSVINKDILAKKEGENKRNKNIKNYLPLYLRKKLNSLAPSEGRKTENKLTVKKKEPIPLVADEITKDLINIPEKILNNNCMIFRNEVNTENNLSNIQSQFRPESIKTENSQSPQSEPSSTCSSPNSVATVRLASTKNKTMCTRRNSTSSDRSGSGILEPENKTTKNKKFSRRVKSNKKLPQNILSPCSNKENIPETSKNTVSSDKDVRKDVGKYACLGRTKSIFMAQMTTESSSLPLMYNTISKTKMQDTNNFLKLTNINYNDEPNIVQSGVPILTSLVGKNSAIEHFESNDGSDISSSFDTDSRVLIYETLNNANRMESTTRQMSNEAHDKSRKSIHTSKSSIISAIRELLENKLNLAKNSTYDSHDSDSETVILSKSNIYVNNSDYSLAPLSFNTLLINQESCESENGAENSQTHCTDVMVKHESGPDSENFQSLDTESDLLSLKSFASVSASKFSEYYLADNELESTLPQINAFNSNSVQDIFERKEPLISNVGGALALQAFSGFSVNETIAGHQPDFVNYIDSETGSYAFESARHAASEEIFVSGRSSDTYESCYVDDDAYVPNWLFNIISHQESAEESAVDEFNLPLAIPEPPFDMNGNVMGPEVGVGAGAGDGRGMHSDHSQDSSGRGTSLSSSATSSGPQSEARLIDPSTFTSQAEYLRESPPTMPVGGPTSRPDAPSVQHVDEHYGTDISHSQQRNAMSSLLASDIDADVSSLDTDVVDSD